MPNFPYNDLSIIYTPIHMPVWPPWWTTSIFKEVHNHAHDVLYSTLSGCVLFDGGCVGGILSCCPLCFYQHHSEPVLFVNALCHSAWCIPSTSLSLLPPWCFSCNRVQHLECPPQSQVKLLCIRLSNAITVVWHSSSSRMVSVFQFICVSRSEPHTNVVSDAPHDLITMWPHGHSSHRCIALFHGLAPWCMQSCSSMVWVIHWQCSSMYPVHVNMFICVSHTCHFLRPTYSQSVHLMCNKIYSK